MYDVDKFNYSPWYSGNGPDKTKNAVEPFIQVIKAKLNEMEKKIKLYKVKHDIFYSSKNMVNKNKKTELTKLKADINQLAKEINIMLNKISHHAPRNKAAMNTKVSTLLQRNKELQHLYARIEEKHTELITMDASYHNTRTKTESNLFLYTFYFIIVVFIVGSLMYIYTNPQDGNLDVFILALAVVIFVYYVYDYYKRYKA